MPPVPGINNFVCFHTQSRFDAYTSALASPRWLAELSGERLAWGVIKITGRRDGNRPAEDVYLPVVGAAFAASSAVVSGAKQPGQNFAGIAQVASGEGCSVRRMLGTDIDRAGSPAHMGHKAGGRFDYA